MIEVGTEIKPATSWYPCPGCDGSITFITEPEPGAMHKPYPPCKWFDETDTLEIARTTRILQQSKN